MSLVLQVSKALEGQRLAEDAGPAAFLLLFWPEAIFSMPKWPAP